MNTNRSSLFFIFFLVLARLLLYVWVFVWVPVAHCWCSTSLDLSGGHSSYPPLYFKRVILLIKLYFIGVRSLACKMVYWLHPPPLLLIVIRVRAEMPLSVSCVLCEKEKNELKSMSLHVIYWNLHTKVDHVLVGDIGIQSIQAACALCSVCSCSGELIRSLEPAERCVTTKVTSSVPVCNVTLVTLKQMAS